MRTLELLREEYQDCQKCSLSCGRHNVVFGYGNPNAQIMIVGEAPGEQEDLSGRPFIGPAGQWLDCYLASVSVHPELIEQTNYRINNPTYYDPARVRELLLEEYYFTNTICCRPPENRDPTNIERAACQPRLLEQIYLVDPVLILAAGKVSMEVLMGKKVTSILAKRGELFEATVPGKFTNVTYSCMGILHPSFLMRANDSGPGSYSEKTYNDVLTATHIIDEYNLLHYGIAPPANRPRLAKYDGVQEQATRVIKPTRRKGK